MKLSTFVFVIAFICIPKSAISVRNNFPIDDFLNSDIIKLFPNVTINLQINNLQNEILERFRGFLDDDEVLNEAYDSFKPKDLRIYRTFLDKGNQRGHYYKGVQRKFLFKENLVYIFNHNLFGRHKLKSGFEMEVNQFTDMHIDEFKSERLGLILPVDNLESSLIDLIENPLLQSNDSISEARYKDLPSSFDWRDHNVISPVKDQLKCATCVLFALTAALEGRYAICKNKEIVDLSEQFIMDCAVRENGYRNNKGCDGNYFTDSLKFAVDHGITFENLYPYTAQQGKCSFDGMRPAVELKGFKKLKDNVNHAKYVVANDGPVAIGVQVFKSFVFYKKGVYDHCGNTADAIGGHAMAITGFKDETSNVKYYIIKNNWSDQWGENGYVRYTSTDPSCGLQRNAYSLHLKGC